MRPPRHDRVKGKCVFTVAVSELKGTKVSRLKRTKLACEQACQNDDKKPADLQQSRRMDEMKSRSYPDYRMIVEFANEKNHDNHIFLPPPSPSPLRQLTARGSESSRISERYYPLNNDALLDRSNITDSRSRLVRPRNQSVADAVFFFLFSFSRMCERMPRTFIFRTICSHYLCTKGLPIYRK